jgi:beta-lactamase regulating signal transducer with metallopeptidase domain
MTATVADAAVFVTNGAGLSILLKATLVLALGLAAARLARRQRASLRHLVLAATFAMLVALPLVMLIGPEVSIQLPSVSAAVTRPSFAAPVTGSVAAPGAPASAAAASGRRVELPTWTTVAAGAWGLGAVLIIVSLIVDLWRVRRVVRDGLPWIDLQRRLTVLAGGAGRRRHVEVLTHGDVPAPFVYGVGRPSIVLPADASGWSEADLDRALVHELEHVRRGDWLVQLVARFATACYWCHPLAWVAWRRLCLEAERACDDAVVQRAERTDYAEQLVTMAQRMSRAPVQPVLGMANRSDLARRVSALLDATQRRGRVGAVPAAVAIAAAVLIGAAIAPVRAVGVPPNRDVAFEVSSEAAQQTRAARAPRTPASALNAALYEAASEGDDEGIAQLLLAGADVNAAISGDGSPLIGAAREGRLSTVRLLLERGASVDMAVPGDGNPLIMAAGEGHLAVVTLLLDRGASVDLAVPGDENALIQASGNGHLEIVKLLVSRGANVNTRIWADTNRADGEWRTPLGMARRGRHTAVVEFLQSAGAVD